MTCFDCKVCFGSKFTSSAEGRRFNWLIYDSMTSLFACGRFSKSRGLSASVSFLPSFPFPFPLFYSLHSSPCNSLLPNCTETLATQAISFRKRSTQSEFLDVFYCSHVTYHIWAWFETYKGNAVYTVFTHNYLHFYYFAIHAFYSNFLIAF